MDGRKPLADAFRSVVKKATASALNESELGIPSRPQTRSRGHIESESDADSEVFVDANTSPRRGDVSDPGNQTVVADPSVDPDTMSQPNPNNPTPGTSAQAAATAGSASSGNLTSTPSATGTRPRQHANSLPPSRAASPAVTGSQNPTPTGEAGGSSAGSSSSTSSIVTAGGYEDNDIEQAGLRVHLQRTKRAFIAYGQSGDRLKVTIDTEGSVGAVTAAHQQVDKAFEKASETATAMLEAIEESITFPTDAAKTRAINTTESNLQILTDVHVQNVGKAHDYLSKTKVASGQERGGAKLAQLKLPTFAGKVIEFRAFKDAFNAAVGRRRDLTNSEKLQYLKRSCAGDVSKLLEMFAIVDANYPRAMAALDERYGKTSAIMDATVKELRELNAATASVADQRRLIDEVKVLLSILDDVGSNCRRGFTARNIISDVKPKLRRDLISRWHIHIQDTNDDETDLDTFIRFVERELTHLQRTEEVKRGASKTSTDSDSKRSNNERKPAPKKGKIADRRRGGTALAGTESQSSPAREGAAAAGSSGGGAKGGRTQPKPKPSVSRRNDGAREQGKPDPNRKLCLFCGSNDHKPTACPKGQKMTPSARRSALSPHGCWRCLAGTHMRGKCSLPLKECGIDGCRGDHHAWIHAAFARKH